MIRPQSQQDYRDTAIFAYKHPFLGNCFSASEEQLRFRGGIDLRIGAPRKLTPFFGKPFGKRVCFLWDTSGEVFSLFGLIKRDGEWGKERGGLDFYEDRISREILRSRNLFLLIFFFFFLFLRRGEPC